MKSSLKTALVALCAAACALTAAAQTPQSGPQPKVALYIVSSELNDAEKRVLTAKFLKPFTESGAFGVVDRSNVFTDKATQERLKQRDGSVNDDEIYKIGYESGAKYLLIVDLAKTFGKSYNVSARMVDVETAEVFGSQGEVDIKNLEDISDAADEVFTQITGRTGSRMQAKKQHIQSRRDAARWLAAGAGTGAIPDNKAGAYSGAIPGVAGTYFAGRFGGTYGESPHTWGVGLTVGGGLGSGGNARIGAGVNLYIINDLFIQASYGTAVYAYTTKNYESGAASIRNVNESGFAAMVGYDYHIQQLQIGPGHIVISIAAGAVNAEEQGWLAGYSAAVGYAFNY